MTLMREFKNVGVFPQPIFEALQKKYQIQDDRFFMNSETVSKIITDHPEFKTLNIQSFVNDIFSNASMIQPNQRDDTVRVIGINRDLTDPFSGMSGDKFFYIILRLSNKHEVNFVKSLYPRDKLKGCEFLWQKPTE